MLNLIIAKGLRTIADSLDAKTSYLTELEALDVINKIAEYLKPQRLSKELACKYLNVSRSKFDSMIRRGIIPKGEKVLGFKELSWNLLQLDMVLNTCKQHPQN